jgi:hypothetical protein
MLKLTADLSDPLLELIRAGRAPIDAVEVGPLFSIDQVRQYRQLLPEMAFYFHAADLIASVGLLSSAISKIAAYQACTESPWVSVHITMGSSWMVRLALKRGWRLPHPNPERTTQRIIRQVQRLSRSLQT